MNKETSINITMKYKRTIIIVTITAILVLLLSQCHSSRYYKVNNTTFTIQCKIGGGCYIMPYEYSGFFAPKKDYIKLRKTDNLSIYIVKDSSFVVLENQSLAGYPNITYSFINYEFEIYKQKDYQCDNNHQRNLKLLNEYSEMMRYYNTTYPFISICLKEMLIHTNGENGKTLKRLMEVK